MFFFRNKKSSAYDQLNFYITKMCNGHNYFKRHLNRIRKACLCWNLGRDGNLFHILFECKVRRRKTERDVPVYGGDQKKAQFEKFWSYNTEKWRRLKSSIYVHLQYNKKPDGDEVNGKRNQKRIKTLALGEMEAQQLPVLRWFLSLTLKHKV